MRWFLAFCLHFNCIEKLRNTTRPSRSAPLAGDGAVGGYLASEFPENEAMKQIGSNLMGYSLQGTCRGEI